MENASSMSKSSTSRRDADENNRPGRCVQMSEMGHSRLFGLALGVSGLLLTPDTFQWNLWAVSRGGEHDMKTTRN